MSLAAFPDFLALEAFTHEQDSWNITVRLTHCKGESGKCDVSKKRISPNGRYYVHVGELKSEVESLFHPLTTVLKPCFLGTTEAAVSTVAGLEPSSVPYAAIIGGVAGLVVLIVLAVVAFRCKR